LAATRDFHSSQCTLEIAEKQLSALRQRQRVFWAWQISVRDNLQTYDCTAFLPFFGKYQAGVASYTSSVQDFSSPLLQRMSASQQLLPSVSNGNPREQALIRRWWQDIHGAKGHIVWEYYLQGCYVDAIWFPDSNDNESEYGGLKAPKRFPLENASVVLCEAKRRLTHQLIGQALVYGVFARRSGACVRSTVIFAETAHPSLKNAAETLGLQVVLFPRLE
jgi:hypothetical protein